jgi:hypothetical protein
MSSIMLPRSLQCDYQFNSVYACTSGATIIKACSGSCKLAASASQTSVPSACTPAQHACCTCGVAETSAGSICESAMATIRMGIGPVTDTSIMDAWQVVLHPASGYEQLKEAGRTWPPGTRSLATTGLSTCGCSLRCELVAMYAAMHAICRRMKPHLLLCPVLCARASLHAHTCTCRQRRYQFRALPL